MVKKLTKADETAINATLEKAKEITLAKISVIVLPFSDHFYDFILLYGIMIGSIASLLLWDVGTLSFPWLLTVQLSIIAVMDLVPLLRGLCLRLVPKRVVHHRARKIAQREYLALHAEAQKDEPFVLLFVSLAERYVHVLTSPVIHQKIPDNWGAVTNRFINVIATDGLRSACTKALDHIAEILEPHFPKK